MEFLSLSRKHSSARNVPSGEERGQTGCFRSLAQKRFVINHVINYHNLLISKNIPLRFDHLTTFKGGEGDFEKPLAFCSASRNKKIACSTNGMKKILALL